MELSADAEYGANKKRSSHEQARRRKELVNSLRAVPGLPLFRQRQEYASINKEFPPARPLPDGFLSNDPLPVGDADEIADVLIARGATAETISEQNLGSAIDALCEAGNTSPRPEKGSQIVDFVLRGGTPEERQRRIDIVEDAVARGISSKGMPASFPIIALLGEIDGLGNSLFPREDFAKKMEAAEDALPLRVENQLDALIRANDPQGNLLAHKIIDFFSADITALQNIAPDEEPLDEYGNSYNRFALKFVEELAKDATERVENYLLGAHLDDVYKAVHSYDRYDMEEGVVSGIAGGASNKTIYTYRRMFESYNLRMRYGITEGNPIANAVLPIAPGYLGQYRAGRLESIFDISHGDEEPGIDEGHYIARNDPADEAIYDALAIGSPRYGSLRQLEDLWSFDRKLHDAGRKFFFDLERIDVDGIHPFVAGEILRRNAEYVTFEAGKSVPPPILSKEEYLRRLFPAGTVSEEAEYHYQYLMRLSMRKVLEDDLLIDMADFPLSAQVQFLHYIDGRNVDEIQRLKAGLDKIADDASIHLEWHRGGPEPDLHPERIYIKNFATSFLACSEGGTDYGDAIIRLANILDRDDARKLFEKYAEIAAVIEKVREYLRDNFSSGQKTDEELVNQVARNLLRRGNELIEHFVDATELGTDTRDLFERLDDIKAEVVLFTSTIKALKQGSGKLPADLRDLGLAEFNVSSGADLKKDPPLLEEMRRIYQKNYGNRTEYPEKFIDALIQSFDASLDNPDTRFYLFKHKGAVAAFCRFDHTFKNGRLDSIYFGSFNTSPAYGRGKVGETMLDQALREERALGVPIFADCNPMAPVTKRYIESGFVATEAYDYKGVPSLKIELSPDADKGLASKKISGREIVSAIKKNQNPEEGIMTREYPSGDSPDWSPLRNGYILTHYFDDAGRTICVFEKPGEKNKGGVASTGA